MIAVTLKLASLDIIHTPIVYTSEGKGFKIIGGIWVVVRGVLEEGSLIASSFFCLL